MNDHARVLVHLAAGIGNIVLATPLLDVLARNGFTVDLLLDADYADVGELFEGWSAVRYVGSRRTLAHSSYEHVVVAVPPFYWRRFCSRYARIRVVRPPDELFYENEQAYYLEFARFLGCDVRDASHSRLPIRERAVGGTVVLAPGSKPAEMAAKRWPFFSELAAAFDDVALVGTGGDLARFDGTPMDFQSHVRSYIGRLSLRETASVMATAAVVVANDCGLGHLAGALGAPTVLLFGPTPHRTLGPLPPNVRVLRAGLQCEPCWFGARFRACSRRIECLHQLRVETVIEAVHEARASATARAMKNG